MSTSVSMMNIVFYTDETPGLALEPLVKGLNGISSGITFSAERSAAVIKGPQISNPRSYRSLVLPNRDQYSRADYIIVWTTKPYDNNYFFDSPSNVIIISFSGWEQFTTLPLSNGLVYFICAILADYLEMGPQHEENCGCIQDFLWDKRGVDLSMRAAFICPECRAAFIRRKASDEAKAVFASLEAILDNLCVASRSSQDIADFWTLKADTSKFDVFLCHNSEEKEEVRLLNESLKALSIKTWLDEEQLAPGKPWQDELEAQISSIRSAVICVGMAGQGPWQHVELRAFIQEF
ncbi:MAG TPA: toll/interleukin-1 receptor domain-containing protein, partial [Pyrinomonadaceae bacterium]|nr:toll/interleukin-1 receptor domain-containing protein [Pyrinomonadaceae bacterium]